MFFFISLILISFIAFQNCHAFFPLDDLQLLAGPCPKVEGTNDFVNVLDGKWYVHWTAGMFSPWSYLQCHSRRIYLNPFGLPQKIMTRSKLPLKLPFVDEKLEFTGYLRDVNDDQFDVEYYYRFFISLGQFNEKFAILYTHSDGAALMWNCFDFEDFHFESASFMTKFTDSNDSQACKEAHETAEAKIKELKIPGKKIFKIDHTNCEGVY